ncbi:hypothetical protein AAVH_11959 [Aphelenchoides avenae]|nr:hypothetical protein AAVH_11959 [Aphelenchus avenae]
MGDKLIHFPITDWLKKHQAIEDNLRQQLEAKDQQLDALTQENAQLAADYEHLQNEYVDLQERQDRTSNSANVLQPATNCSYHEQRVRTLEQEVQTDDLDPSPSTPITEYSLAPTTSTRVKDNPEKLLKWGQKHKDREEKLREELSATEFKLSKWMKEHSYLKGVVEAQQANVVKLEEKLRYEESANNAAIMELQGERQKLARMSDSATSLQQQLDAERHAGQTTKSRIEELQADGRKQIDVKDKIIAKLLEEKNTLQASLEKLSAEKLKQRSSSAHSAGSSAEVPTSTSELGSSQCRQPRRTEADRSSHTVHPKKSRRDHTFSKPAYTKHSTRPFGGNSQFHQYASQLFQSNISLFSSQWGRKRSVSPLRHKPYVETPPSSSQAGSGAILRIGNLDPAVTNDDLEKVLQRFGPIIIFYIEDGGGEDESANSAVVKFEQENDASRALRELNGTKLAGMRIAVTMHKQAS